MPAYPSKAQTFIRFLYHFALFPYVMFTLLSPMIIYLLIREDVQVWGNLLKLLEQAGVTSIIEIILFIILAVVCLVLPFVAMFLAYRKFNKSGVKAFVLSVYVLIPLLGIVFFKFVAKIL